MMDLVIGRFPYFFTVLLMLIGLYGMMADKNLLKKIIGLNIFQGGIILFFIVQAAKWNATVPIIDSALGNNPEQYINPLPHGLMLTAIVVSVATTGVALSLVITIYKRFGTLQEDAIRERQVEHRTSNAEHRTSN